MHNREREREGGNLDFEENITKFGVETVERLL